MANVDHVSICSSCLYLFPSFLNAFSHCCQSSMSQCRCHCFVCCCYRMMCGCCRCDCFVCCCYRMMCGCCRCHCFVCCCYRMMCGCCRCDCFVCCCFRMMCGCQSVCALGGSYRTPQQTMSMGHGSDTTWPAFIPWTPWRAAERCVIITCLSVCV